MNRIQADRQILLAAIGVADRAVLHVGCVSRRAHDREEDAGEVVSASPIAHDDVGILGRPIWIGRGVHAIVKTVNQQIEVDALRRLGPVRRDHGVGRWLASVFDGLWHSTQYSVLLRRPPCSIRSTWQPLQLASATTVRRGGHSRAIHGEVHDRILRAELTDCEEVVPASTVTVMRASPPMV